MGTAVCPRCTHKFNCRPESSCWCFDITLSTELEEWIAREYTGCLCPACLKELQEWTGLKKGPEGPST